MSNTVTGTIQSIGETTQITEKFSKAELILQTNDMYPQVLCLEFGNKSADLLAAFGVGDIVEVDININGREWTNPQGEVKYFTSLSAWKIALAQGLAAPSQPRVQGNIEKRFEDDAIDSMTEDDDLPF